MFKFKLNTVIWFVIGSVIQCKKVLMVKEDLTKIDPNAVCNDGTPAIYFWKESPTNSTEWLLYFEGGEFCNDDTSCTSRLNDCHLSSSRCDHEF